MTIRRRPDRVLVAVVGAAVKGDFEFEERILNYENMLQRGQIPPVTMLAMKQPLELIYEVIAVDGSTRRCVQQWCFTCVCVCVCDCRA